MRLSRRVRKLATIISARTPLLKDANAARGKYHEDQHTLFATMLKAHKLVTLGDFKAPFGTHHFTWTDSSSTSQNTTTTTNTVSEGNPPTLPSITTTSPSASIVDLISTCPLRERIFELFSGLPGHF
nr:unnamed protein product [Spirometra erinaceieuropaei]